MQGEEHHRLLKTFLFDLKTDITKGLVSNGAKVYVVALPTDPIAEIVNELNQLGSETGGSAYGYVLSSILIHQLTTTCIICQRWTD
jgi:hypothetical protein